VVTCVDQGKTVGARSIVKGLIKHHWVWNVECLSGPPIELNVQRLYFDNLPENVPAKALSLQIRVDIDIVNAKRDGIESRHGVDLLALLEEGYTANRNHSSVLFWHM
jgi:hypothetical protein